MEREIKHYDEIQGIKSLECVCALSFPSSATEFQKSALVLSHLMASVREIVLKGGEVPAQIVGRIDDLVGVMLLTLGEQK